MTNDFRFKRFTVRQSGAAMKVGTDGVLLGAWCTVAPDQTRVLDIGTGTGLIALMVAQRGESWQMEVDAVEIDREACDEAAHNFSQSPWPQRLHAHNRPIQEYTSGCNRKYDLIVSNPPYFERSLLPPDTARAAARHTGVLTFTELVGCASPMLSPKGILSVILPHETAPGFISTASEKGLNLIRRTDVRPTPASAPKRSLMEFGYQKAPVLQTGSLVIESDGRHAYSEEYMALTRDFYLKF